MLLKVNALYNMIKLIKYKFEKQKKHLEIKRRIVFSCFRISKFLRRDLKHVGPTIEARSKKKI